MNIRAERIEQTIQIINRNLLLIYSGQNDDVTPLDFRNLQKVDASVFGNDKFAFEMVYFIKSSKKIDQYSESLGALWDRNFVMGLETLMVECALVKDDIERDCFVSRVYCWFTEKLAERRDLPRIAAQNDYDGLKTSVQSLGVVSEHTMKGLEMMSTRGNVPTEEFSPAKSLDQSPGVKQPVENIEDELRASQRALGLPSIPNNGRSTRNVPAHVKMNVPDVFKPRPDYNAMLPKIPGAEDNYGMIYNKPESEAEKTMHELWIARRRQEAFEWKTRQHMALVMDRLALQKSRLESDTLRRHESNLMMDSLQISRVEGRPTSADDIDAKRRYVPFTGPRPRSGSKFSSGKQAPSFRRQNNDDLSIHSNESSPERSRLVVLADDNPQQPTTINLIDNGIEMEAQVPKPGRVVVTKPRPSQNNGPMRFRSSLPDAYSSSQKGSSKTLDRGQFYMQLSDSDDDDKPDRALRITTAGGSRPATKGGKAPAKPAIVFKHEKPVIRERPQSAKLFRRISAEDPELKVHYRHTNYRRMPLTETQEQWIEEREAERVKKSEDIARTLLEEAAKKADKKKKKDEKGDKKDKKDKDKGKDKGKDKKAAAAAATAEPEKPKCKYKSAQHFMAAHFPDFDNEDNCPDALGPMRTMQLIECARVMGACSEFGVDVKESTVRRALLIPQDRPEAICLENIRDPGEGLMMNPNPPEYWRQVNISAGKKGKKKGKKKK